MQMLKDLEIFKKDIGQLENLEDYTCENAGKDNNIAGIYRYERSESNVMMAVEEPPTYVKLIEDRFGINAQYM